MKESRAMMRKEVSFMKKKGAPKSMIKHEEAEMEGKKMRKFAEGGSMKERMAASKARLDAINAKNAANRARVDAVAQRTAARAAPPIPSAPAPRGGTPSGGGSNALDSLRNRFAAPTGGAAPSGGMGGARGNMAPMRKGGSVFRKAADGVAHKGKTKGKMVKMREGGSVFRKVADGIASKGKTKGKMVKMAYGGKC